MKTKAENRNSQFGNKIFQLVHLIAMIILMGIPLFGKATESPQQRKIDPDVKFNHAILEKATDKNLEIESWMTNDAHFGSFNILLKIEKEPPMEVEAWMSSERHFNRRMPHDKELKIEPWMFDDAYWMHNLKATGRSSNDLPIVLMCQ
jgi:hypothetical protein